MGVPLAKGKLTGTRETASGDDVMRESLAEFDRNLGTLAGIVHGVACRADNHTIKMKIDSLLATAGKNGLTISLDVSVWSPNMIRGNEMEFCDILLSFYDVPEAMKVSRVFKDVSAVTSRDDYHDMWMTTDGSVQGFFGSADIILHSMIGQFGQEKSGLVSKKSKVQKITLIDDIIMAISEAPRNRRQILDFISDVYRNLGFEPDLVKTLMAATKGHFLNRLYSGSFEVITAAKIFAKADREWERSMSTVWDRVNTIMGAFRGASDRGANPDCNLEVYDYYIPVRGKRLQTGLSCDCCVLLVDTCAGRIRHPEFLPLGLQIYGEPLDFWARNSVQDCKNHQIHHARPVCGYS